MSYAYVIMVFGNDIGKIINSFYSEYTESKDRMLAELKDYNRYDRLYPYRGILFDDCRYCTIEGWANGFAYDRNYEERDYSDHDFDYDDLQDFYYIINPLVCSELRYRARKLLTA